MEQKDEKINPEKKDAGKPLESLKDDKEVNKKDCRANCMHCGVHCIYLKNN